MSRNVIDILTACKLLANIGEAGFQRLAVMARICKFPKSYTVFREGDDCPGVYVVDEGLVRIFRTGAGGKEHVLHMVGPGETFAEVAAVGGFKCPANAETIEATTCILLPIRAFRKALQDDHGLCLCMMTGVSCWAQNLVGLMGEVVLHDAVGRVARFLLEAKADGDDTLELPGLKRHIANHLNLTSETFSRTLRKLAEMELIAQPQANRVQLLDRKRLGQLAEGMLPPEQSGKRKAES